MVPPPGQGVGNVETAVLGGYLGPAHPQQLGSSPAVEKKPEEKEANIRVDGTRKKGRKGYLTIGQPQRFEGGSRSDSVGGVNEVEGCAKDP